jgi:hypothetical protein
MTVGDWGVNRIFLFLTLLKRNWTIVLGNRGGHSKSVGNRHIIWIINKRLRVLVVDHWSDARRGMNERWAMSVRYTWVVPNLPVIPHQVSYSEALIAEWLNQLTRLSQRPIVSTFRQNSSSPFIRLLITPGEIRKLEVLVPTSWKWDISKDGRGGEEGSS